MKQQKLFFLKLASLLTFLLFLSCNDDLYNNHEHNLGENKNKITLSQFKSETKIKDFKTIIKSNIQAMKSTNRVAELSDFVIDTLAIQRHISQNNKTTYSFKIYPLSNVSQPNEIFNLVYRLENNNWEQSIFSLIKKSNPLPSEEQFENKTLLFDSKTTSTTARAGEMCISEMYYVQCDGSCHGQCDGFACPTGQCIQKTIIIDFCSGSGGAPGGGSDPNSGSPTGYIQSGYIPTNPYEFTPNMFDNPVYDDPNYVNAIKAQHFFSNLSYAHQVWANENVEAYNQLIQYQIDNDWSDESEAFAEELIGGLINNTQSIYTITDYPGKNDGMPFEWWKDNNYMASNLEVLEEDPNPAELLAFSLFPDKALLHIQNSTTALDKTQQLVINNTLTGIEDGRADAFRHAYWNALGTAEFGSNITQIFTDAHEAYSSGLPKQMDLHNNRKGREKAITMSFNFLTSDSAIADSILIEVYVGHLLFINNGVLTPTD